MAEEQLSLPFNRHWAFFHQKCTATLPYEEPLIVPTGEHSHECLLHNNHDGPHLMRTHRGEFIVWDTEYRDHTFDDEASDDLLDDIELHWDELEVAHVLRLLAESPVFVQKSLTDS